MTDFSNMDVENLVHVVAWEKDLWNISGGGITTKKMQDTDVGGALSRIQEKLHNKTGKL